MLAKVFRHSVVRPLTYAMAGARARLAGFVPFRVLGVNMEPTLQKGELGLAKPLGAAEAMAPNGRVVVYRSAKHQGVLVPSRIVALPADSVEIRNGELLVNDRTVPEPYVRFGRAEQPHSRSFPRTIVPDGSVFLLGDFRDMSDDSRTIGSVPIGLLIGQVVQSVSPGSGSSPRTVR